MIKLGFLEKDISKIINMLEKTVSVVIPVFNRGRSLREAIMSVLLQTYEKIEIIIVDDGSTDDTKVTVRELQTKWPRTVRFFWQTNSGPGRARELGTLKSRGEFIQYLDSDDLLLSNKFKYQVMALQNYPECGISYGISYQEDYSFDPPLLTGPIRSTGEEIGYLFPKLLNERWWTTSCPLYRKTIIKTIGSWMDLINEEDWEFDARAARLHTSLTWVAMGVSIRRINMSSDHLSFGGCSDARKVSDRVIAKELLFDYARQSDIKLSDPEMQIFARECFLLSRQCALLGLEDQSESMFTLARNASTFYRRNGPDYLLYSIFVYLMGWVRTGRLASKIRNML
jgi:glycosyltransferase involved in cell wall biosynthesis